MASQLISLTMTAAQLEEIRVAMAYRMDYLKDQCRRDAGPDGQAYWVPALAAAEAANKALWEKA